MKLMIKYEQMQLDHVQDCSINVCVNEIIDPHSMNKHRARNKEKACACLGRLLRSMDKGLVV